MHELTCRLCQFASWHFYCSVFLSHSSASLRHFAVLLFVELLGGWVVDLSPPRAQGWPVPGAAGYSAESAALSPVFAFPTVQQSSLGRRPPAPLANHSTTPPVTSAFRPRGPTRLWFPGSCSERRQEGHGRQSWSGLRGGGRVTRWG